MFWLTVIAAASLSAPERIKDRSWWSYADVPQRLLQDEIVYYVGYALIVDPRGKVLDCRIEESSGIVGADKHACSIARARARLTPATDALGTPTFGAYRETTSFWMGNKVPPKWREPRADLDISVPRDVFAGKAKEFIKLALSVDERGHPTGCGPTRKETKVQLVGPACAAAVANLKLAPVHDGKSQYVPSVQNISVGVQGR